MKSVFVIMSPGGGIGLNINDGKGTCYIDKNEAEKELEGTNSWSKSKGYGVYGLVELVIEDSSKKPLNGDMCPVCKKPLFGEEDKYCNNCGQAIDWSK